MKLSVKTLIGFLTVGCLACSGAMPEGTSQEPAAVSAKKIDAGCAGVGSVICINGGHWDPTLCQCVPDACVSQSGGPCGGFTQNPCTCAPGLVCVTNPIPDIPGTCQPSRCCPLAWDMYSCNETDGGSGLACHNPQLECPSSLTCGGGCDFEVTGRCPVCDPLVCPAGEHWDLTLCQCVPTCATAADCTGALPQFCEVCADGGAGCAHFECISGACQIATCD